MIARSISPALGVPQGTNARRQTVEPIVLLIDGSSNTLNRPE